MNACVGETGGTRGAALIHCQGPELKLLSPLNFAHQSPLTHNARRDSPLTPRPLPQARDQLRLAGVNGHLPEAPTRRSCSTPTPEPQPTSRVPQLPVFPSSGPAASGNGVRSASARSAAFTLRRGPGAFGLGGPRAAGQARVSFRVPSLLMWLAGGRSDRLTAEELLDSRRRRGGLATTAQLDHARAEAEREAAAAQAEAAAVAEAVASVAVAAAAAAAVQDDRLAVVSLGFV